jgi:hypothetical protein
MGYKNVPLERIKKDLEMDEKSSGRIVAEN